MPLCPELFNRLEDRYGRVIIVNEGEECDGNLDDKTRKFSMSMRGEQYRVCCRFCHDTKFRLYFSYRWSEFPWLVHCFNETNCMEDPAHRNQLYVTILGVSRRLTGPLPTSKGKEAPEQLVEAVPPGEITPLHELPLTHPANEYLISRNYDPHQLSRDYGVGYCYCASPQYAPMLNRIYIPIHMDGKLVGWQGRMLGDRKDWMRSSAAKYYTMPRMQKRMVLYNYNNAQAYDDVVITEGVTKVWRVGPQAVALLGSSMSVGQRQLLSAVWPRRGKAVLLLDGNVPAKKVEEIAVALRHDFDSRVVVVKLPDQVDPGDLDTDVLWSLIDVCAEDQNLILSSRKKVCYG